MNKSVKAKFLLKEIERITESMTYKITVMKDSDSLEDLLELKIDIEKAQSHIEKLKVEMDSLID